MRNSDLLNLSFESFTGATPDSVLDVETPLSEPVSVPSLLPQTEERLRIEEIANGLDAVDDSLGARVAKIGVDSMLGMESNADSKNTGKASIIRRFATWVMDFLRKFYNFLVELTARLTMSSRYGVRDARALNSTARNTFSKRKLEKYEIEGNAVSILSINGGLPSTTLELTQAFNKYNDSVARPLIGWFRQSAELAERLGTAIAAVLDNKTADKVTDDQINAITSMLAPPAPRNWTAEFVAVRPWNKDKVTGNEPPVCSAPLHGFATASFQVLGDHTTKLVTISGADKKPLCDFTIEEAKGNKGTIMSDMIVELAGLGVGLAETQLDTGIVYTKIQAVTKIALDGYNGRFTNVDPNDVAANERLTKVNDAINGAIGYLSYLVAGVCSYNNYLTDVRAAITNTVESCIERTKETSN